MEFEAVCLFGVVKKWFTFFLWEIHDALCVEKVAFVLERAFDSITRTGFAHAYLVVVYLLAQFKVVATALEPSAFGITNTGLFVSLCRPTLKFGGSFVIGVVATVAAIAIFGT